MKILMKLLITVVMLTNLQVVKAVDLIDRIEGTWEGELINSFPQSVVVREIQVGIDNNGVHFANYFTSASLLCSTQLTYISGNSQGAIFEETVLSGTCPLGMLVLAMTPNNNELLIVRYNEDIGGSRSLDSFGDLACPTCSLKESRAEYDDNKGIVHIPNLDVFDPSGAFTGKTFEADFQLISAPPITLELIGGKLK